MFKFLWLNPLLDTEGDIGAESGVDNASAAEEQLQGSEGTESKTGDEGQAAADPDKQNNFEKAFAKRLAAKEAEWEAKNAEKFKDHDAYKKAAEYLQRTAGISDILTLREEIELVELQERAEKEQVPPAVLKRIDQLEEKAAKGDKLEAEQNQQKEWQAFETSLKFFCEGKEIDGKAVDHTELWKYMHDNDVSKPEIALKAMKADVLEAKLETAKTDAVNDYLKSKQAPKIDGTSGAAAQTTNEPAKNFKEAEQRMLSRVQAAKVAQ